MAKQDSFTTAEWALLRLAPSLVAGGVGAADPSGLFASMKEAASSAMGMAEAYKANAGLELFAALAADRSMPDMPETGKLLGEGSREQQLQNFKAAVLERVATAVATVAAKGTHTEADAYRAMLVSVAERAANAANEGGFLGFGGVRVSDGEQSFITEVKRAAGVA